MATIASLVVEMSANTRSFRRAVEDVTARAKRMSTQLRSMLSKTAKAVAAAAATAAAAVTAVVTQTSTAMQQLVRDAQAVGTTARDLQTWQYAARSMGVETEKVGDIFKDTQDKIGDFIRTGGGEAADLFNQLGLNAQDFIGLAPDQALLRIGNALDGLSQSEKIFFMESIADDASRLLPLLDNNAARFKELAAQGEEFGNIMSNAEIQASAALGKTLKEATNMARGFKNLLGAYLAPTFSATIAWIRDLTGEMGGPREAAQRMAAGIRDSFLFVANAVDGVIRVFELAGRGIAVMVLKAQQAINDLALTIYSGPVKAINFLIEQWNKIPGMDLGSVDQPAFVKDLENRSAMLEGAIGAGLKDLQSTAMESLAGDAIRQRIEAFSNSTQESAQAAQNFAQGVNEAVGLLPTRQQASAPGVATQAANDGEWWQAYNTLPNLNSIRPQSAEQVAASMGVVPTASQTGVPPRWTDNATSGQRHTVDIKVNGESAGEVEADEAFAARLADALSGAAAGTSSR